MLKYIKHNFFLSHTLDTHIVQDGGKVVIWFWTSFKSKYVKFITTQEKKSSCFLGAWKWVWYKIYTTMEYWYPFQLSAEVKIREKLHFGIPKTKVWHKDQFLGLDALFIY